MRGAVPLFTLYAIMAWYLINHINIFVSVWSVYNCSFSTADSVINKNLTAIDIVSIAEVIED